LNPTKDFDFIANAPSAAWTNSSGAKFLHWGGSEADSSGFRIVGGYAFLEDGSLLSRVLESHPEWELNGNIWGDYRLNEPIKQGDRFRATVGLLQGAAVFQDAERLYAGGKLH
jgi:hypothetical protein